MTNISHKINQVEDKISNLFKQCEALEAEAKANLLKSKESKGSAKDMYKQRCLLALKKKKTIEGQIKSLNGQQNMLQQAVFTAENIQNHKQMYEGLKTVVDAQKQAIKEVDLDKIDDLRDEMLDMKMQSDMMNQMLNRNYDLDYDQDEFEQDFMEFEKQVAKEKKKIGPNQIAQKQNIVHNNMDIDSFLK